MTIRDLLELLNDASNIRIRIFNCNIEDIIFDSDNLSIYEDPVAELCYSDIGEAEVGSIDLYLHDGVVNLEINVDYDEDEGE
jgi:hypothetical protein